MNELYQLVALDKNNIEYVIELKNDNKKNKGTLEFIDSGTVRFRDAKHLAGFLFNKGKIPTKDVVFSIKYSHKGDRYLPLIYNDTELLTILTSENNDAYGDFAFILLKRLEIELSDKHFYKFLLDKNIKNKRIANNGNYYDMHLMKSINEYYKKYIATGDIDSNRAYIQNSILNELLNYKQLRTIYYFYNEYRNNKEQIIQDHLFEKYNIQSPIYEEYEQMPDIPDYIYEAYKNGGMDEVYAIADLDDIFQKGIRFK